MELQRLPARSLPPYHHLYHLRKKVRVRVEITCLPDQGQTALGIHFQIVEKLPCRPSTETPKSDYQAILVQKIPEDPNRLRLVQH